MLDLIDRQSETLTLLADIGNSRIKVSSSDNPAFLLYQCDDVTSLLSWLDTQHFDAFYCASVRNASQQQAINEFCTAKNIRFQSVQTQSDFKGLHNSYADVSTMGVDRWLSMVACQSKIEQLGNKQHFAVLMFGTAITCDFVSNGQHLGGWIIPGRQLMQDALTKNTARVFADSSQAREIKLGNSTPACVDFGCFAAASGVIHTAEAWLRSQFDQYCIFLTGGDDNLLTSQKGDAIVRADNLVLQGLSRYADYR